MSSIQLSAPRTTLAEVLYGLITRSEISERDFKINSFRTRLSDLRVKHKIPVRFAQKKGKNVHGHTMVYRVHYLWQASIPRAIRIYAKLNSHG